MDQLTKNVFVETGTRGCNHGFVATSQGVVLVDVPVDPADAPAWAEEIAKWGKIRYIINTEYHFDHTMTNCLFDGTVVASEITKNGGIALCAPIAPYEESRQANRELIGRYGGYIEVYVSTPIEVCEQRDRKGLYAKARAGKIKGVTGVSDPYIPPSNPSLTIDTSTMTPAEAVQEILLHLEEQGYLR